MSERYVYDASALLALLHGETGAAAVEQLLERGGVCGAANWSEVAQKVASADADWDVARAVLLSYPLDIEPVTASDAEHAAQLWERGSGLSLADRLCLALAHRLDATAVTADTAWGARDRVHHIR